MNFKNFIKRSTSFFTAFVLLIVITFSQFSQSVFALNCQGNNPLDFMGYRVASDTKICIWVDKGIRDAISTDQFKLFLGSSSATGTQIGISAAEKNFPNVKVTSNNTTYKGSSGGGGFTITSSAAFIPGQTYTLVTSGSIVANNGHSLWQFNSNKDFEFNFTMPDNTNPVDYYQLNCQELYTKSANVDPLLSSWLTSPGSSVNVPLERNIWFSFNMPLTQIGDVTLNTSLSGGVNLNNNTNNIATAVKVYKNVGTVTTPSWQELGYNPLTNGGDNTQKPTIDGITVPTQDTNELGSPIISDDNTCISIPMSAGGSAISYGYDWNREYKVTLPKLTFINGKTISAKEFTFITVPALPGADMAMITPNVCYDSTTPGNIKISWNTQAAALSKLFTQIGSTAYTTYPYFAPTGYNIYFSTDKYFNFKLLNTEGPVSPAAATTAYSFDSITKGLSFDTTYYFRVSSVNNIKPEDQLADSSNPSTLSKGYNESGMSYASSILTGPAAPNVSADDTANKIVGIDSTMEYRIDNGTWTKYTADPNLSGIHTVEVRVAADDTTGVPAGAVKTLQFTIPAAPAAPAVTADDAANRIVGIDSTMEYSIDGGTWTKYTADPDLSGSHTVAVRVAANDTTEAPAGAVKTLQFTIPAAPAAPAVTADDAANRIVGIDSTMEYSIDGGTWTKYTADPDLSGSHTAAVRVAANDTTEAPAGAVKTLQFTAAATSTVVGVASTVTADPTVPDKANVSVSEDNIKKDGINVISPVIPSSAASVSTSISVSSIKNGAGTEKIEDTIGGNAITLSLPFNVYNLSEIDDAAKFVVTQSVSSDSAILSAAPSGYKTIGKVFGFSLDVAGNAVHNFAEGKTAVISIKLTADDIKGLDTSKLSAYYYDETAKKWIEVGGSFDSKTNLFTFTTTHFSSFTVMQKPAVTSTLPKTGSPIDMYTLIFISTCFMAAGIYLTVKKDSKQ